MDHRAPKQHRSEVAPRGQPRTYDDGTPWSTDDYRQHRREHADQQKETSATVEYFTSVESALIAVTQQQQQLLQQQQNEAGAAAADAAEGGNDDAATSAPAAALGPAMVLDGFCTELTKRLSRDATHLLSHRVVCRVLELALSAAEERHLQAITYALLGKLGKMCLSGAASFVVETLLASIYHVVGRPQQASDAAGNTDDSGGLPPLRELFGLVIDELVEATSALLWDRGGAKCLTAALLVSSGFPVRSVPSNDGFSDFAAVDKLVAALVPILDEPSTVGARNVFADCCVHVSACFIIQALIKASHAHPTNGELKEFVSVNLAPITAQLMQDTVGTRVVECYASTGDDQAWGLVLKLATEAVRAGGTFVPEFAILSLIDGINTVSKAEQLWKEIFAFDDNTLLAWVRLRNGIPAEKQTKPHPLTRFVARIGAPADAELGIAPVATGKKPSARKVDRGKDEEEAWRNELPTEFRRDLCNAVARATRTVCPKGPAHALLVEHIGGTPAGANLLAELLALGRVAASTVVHSVDKIRMEDLPAVAMTPGGSLCLQRYVDAVGPESATQVLDVVDKIAEAKAKAEAAAAEAAAKPLTGALLRLAFKARDKSTDVADKLKPRIPLPPKPQPKTATPTPAAASTPAAPAPTASALLKLTRRLLPSIVTLSKDKYASFLLQHIYLHGALDVRAALCQALADHHGELKLDFIASKLMVHCCVEQYLYRRDEWRAQATRQTHVRKVMAAVIAAEIAHAKKQQTAGAEDTSAVADNGVEAASKAGGAKNNNKANRGRPGTAGGARPNPRPKRERSAAPPTTAAKPAQGRATTAPTTTD